MAATIEASIRIVNRATNAAAMAAFTTFRICASFSQLQQRDCGEQPRSNASSPATHQGAHLASTTTPSQQRLSIIFTSADLLAPPTHQPLQFSRSTPEDAALASFHCTTMESPSPSRTTSEQIGNCIYNTDLHELDCIFNASAMAASSSAMDAQPSPEICTSSRCNAQVPL
ncbi:hypothetical protein DEO72_LG11g1565 [Vigna unguiculata]|uniref:Uncharacterized protein n=1 Tax=Vigna unguiculata TaxID=3917 RepID=A0A4D6NNH3_VIGUN|nr:hypothetical protein DEO72_LG11g1565 [Vigna unguiculata]